LQTQTAVLNLVPVMVRYMYVNMLAESRKPTMLHIVY